MALADVHNEGDQVPNLWACTAVDLVIPCRVKARLSTCSRVEPAQEGFTLHQNPSDVLLFIMV
jgi:hypothetical protein